MTPLLDVRRLTKTYASGHRLGRRGGGPAVDDVSLTVSRGETLGLVGESGSGKTTMGRLVLRLLPPTAGEVWFDGASVTHAPARHRQALRRRMQLVFQDPDASLNPRRSVGDAIGEVLRVHGLAAGPDAARRAAVLMEEVGLDAALAAHYPHELSGGQRQRVGIARALAVSPEFLVLDEPVSALDVSVQAQVLNLLTDLRRARGLTYVFISHDLAVVRHVADRIAVMHAGRIVEEAPAAAVCRTPHHPYTQLLLASVPRRDPHPRPALPPVVDEPGAAAACAFHARCPHPRRDARCREERPVLREIVPGAWTACHHAAPVAGDA